MYVFEERLNVRCDRTTPSTRHRFSAKTARLPDKPKRERKTSAAKEAALAEHLPPNLGKPLKVTTPDFSDPNRPKTCLEVDFPLVPINALSALEGNAGKPIYQMSKWWARRRSCVFRALLLAAAMEAPTQKDADGNPAHRCRWQAADRRRRSCAGGVGCLLRQSPDWPETSRT